MFRRTLAATAAALLAFACLAFALPLAPGAAPLSGTVESGGHHLAGANVRILELDRVAHSGADGSFTFPQVPEGTYHVFASLIGHAAATQVVTVSGESGSVAFDLKESAIPIEQ